LKRATFMGKVFDELWADPEVWVYFAVLGWSTFYCFSKTRKLWPVLAACSFMSVTWWYIIMYTIDYKAKGGTRLFDDAYVDVIKGGSWALSSQLLTWVVVAMAWAHEASLNYLLFGMLGAMSAAFVTWVPLSSQPLTSGHSRHTVPAIFVPCAAAALLCVYKLPHSLDRPEEFGMWLKGLHVLIALPRLVYVLSPWQIKANVNGKVFYSVLAVAIAVYHQAETRHLPLPSSASALTDCQFSISVDLALCSLITLYAVYTHTQSVLWLSVAALAMPVLTPGPVLAGFLACWHSSNSTGWVPYLQLRMADRMRSANSSSKQQPSSSSSSSSSSRQHSRRRTTSTRTAGLSRQPTADATPKTCGRSRLGRWCCACCTTCLAWLPS